MPFKKIIRFAGWPVASGVIAAIILLTLFPHLNEPATKENGAPANYSLSPDDQWSNSASYANAVSRAAPSVVNIYTLKQVKKRSHPLFSDSGFRRLYNNIQTSPRTLQSLGSGVIVNATGFILTNLHVIDGAQEIQVQLYDGREASATIVGSDSETDLAVLKVELDNLTAISLGDYSSASVGDIVLAIGNHSVGRTVTQGIISAKGQRFGLNSGADMIQTDAAINPGNSGGALVDIFGNLLGINRMTLSNNQAIGISFAIPVDTAIKALQDIIEYGSVVRGWLGFNTDLIIHEQINPSGKVRFPALLVTATHPDGPAAKAGLRSGDLVTHFNDNPSTNQNYVRRFSAELRPQDQVQVTISRNNETMTLTMVAELKPQSP